MRIQAAETGDRVDSRANATERVRRFGSGALKLTLISDGCELGAKIFIAQ